ncbi:kinase-like domain-containing protein [Mycena olivaceomarginata]|nr:kinase-like domain-containing protein [Mycena olivaceomarginata]
MTRDQDTSFCGAAQRVPVSRYELPDHLTQDPGLVALTTSFRVLLDHPKRSADIIRIVESYPDLVHEATRVMKRRCTGSYPVAQGGFNTVFLLTFEDGTDALARLRGGPYNDVSSALRSFSSMIFFPSQLRHIQVATLEFVKKHTSIPVPGLYHSESDINNALGTRYTIMQRITGESLGTCWSSMSPEQRKDVVRQLAGIQAQLLQLPFPTIGSIIDGHGTVGPLGLSSTYPFNLRDPHRGPFASSKQFLEAHVRCELSLISDRNQWTLQRTHWHNINGGMDDMPATYAIRWFSLLLAAILALPSEEFDHPHFSLCHDDFSLSNILVSPSGTVVGLVDWQGSRICPLWNGARYATFLQDPNVLEDQQELNSLRELQHDTIFQETGRYPGHSRLRLDYLLHITDYSHSVMASRADLDDIFLEWFAGVVSAGYEKQLEPFLALKLFIEVSPHRYVISILTGSKPKAHQASAFGSS